MGRLQITKRIFATNEFSYNEYKFSSNDIQL